MSKSALKIGLQAMGSDRWIAGVYYISNLVKAIRSLPSEEQPEIALILQSLTERSNFKDIETLVEILPGSDSRNNLPSLQFGRFVRTLVKNSNAAFRFGRWLKSNFINSYQNRALVKLARDNSISLLFPCLVPQKTNHEIPWLPWVWDFQHRYYPGLFPKSECKRRDRLFREFADYAPLIVTSSNDAINDFEKYYPGYKHKLRVLNFRTFPLNSWYGGNVAEIKRTYDLPSRYLMIPNQFFAHKNHKTAFEAVKILKDRGLDLNLICTGNTSDWRSKNYYRGLCDYIRSNDLGERIKILGLIPRHDQIQIMRGAMAIVQPSLFEGWSTVVEDARALGKKLFVSNIKVHKEQDHPKAIYFDPKSAESLAYEIQKTWDTLQEGPCLEDEQAALTAQKGLIEDYARSFLKIASEVIS